jgi:inosine/xanthosine triphosphatase
MEKLRIAVGSKRGPKLDAVQDAFEQVAHLLQSDLSFEVQGFEVESGVGHTPLSSAESMRGARQRGEALLGKIAELGERYHYYVGLEGGLAVLNGSWDRGEAQGDERRVFLESWAYVTDGTRGHFGRSGAIELPAALAYEVLDQGVELAQAIDEFAGSVGIRDGQGAWGVLSSTLITRREAFRLALVAAFAPFYNAKLYCAARAASGS